MTNQVIEPTSTLQTLLDGGIEDAYKRPWHRIERGLRLNRLRAFIAEGPAIEHSMTDDEKAALFLYVQKALDKKLLNTLKIVQYDVDKMKIVSIKGFDCKRNAEGVLTWTLSAKKRTETVKPKTVPAPTRRKEKEHK